MADELADHGPTSPPTGEPTSGWGASIRTVAFAALMGVIIAAATILPYGGVGLVVLAPLLLRASALVGRRRAGLVLPVALVASAPMLLLMPLVTMTDPVVGSCWRCGTALTSALVVLPMMAAIAGVVASGGALVLVAFTPRVLRALAPWTRAALLLLSAALLVAGIVRLARFPQPEAWTSTLRVVTSSADRPHCLSPCSMTFAFEAAGMERTLLLDCGREGCTARLGGARGTSLGSAPDNSIESLMSPWEVRVHDGLRTAVIVDRVGTTGAFDIDSGALRDVSLPDVAAEVAPSPLAVLAMAFALGVAIHRIRRGVGERAAVSRLRSGVEATIDDGGIVHPADGGASFRPPGAILPEGPGVVLGRPGAGAYRSGADRGTWVLSGARASHVETHLDRATVFEWEAIAAICLAGSPLFAAALRGLLL